MSFKTRRPSRRRSWKRALLALSIGIALSLVASELAVRWLIFGESALARRLGDRLRNPANLCDGDSDDDFWKLKHLFTDPARIKPAIHPDRHLGWTGDLVQPGTYVHADEGRVAGRTPVLLYGDSFAQCLTATEDCFQGLLERSDLGARYCLLNYGVSGFGLDQTYLMLAHSIDRFAAQKPIVVISLLVDSDLDRSLLTFRGWPKPRLEIVGDELVAREPETLDAARYVAAHPVSIGSYLLRLAASDGSPLPRGVRGWLRGDHRLVAQKKLLNRKILSEIARVVRSRGLTCTLFLFYSEGALDEHSTWAEWQEPFVREVAEALGIPVVSSRPFLLAAAHQLADGTDRFYGDDGALAAHHNPAGNAVAFAALRQIIAAVPDPNDTTGLARWIESGALKAVEAGPRTVRIMGRRASVFPPGETIAVRNEFAVDPNSPSHDRVPCLFVRGGSPTPTKVRIPLESGLVRWRATVSAFARPDLGCAARPIELEVRVDGTTLARTAVIADSTPLALDIDVTGKRELWIVVDARGAEHECSWIRFASPWLE